MIKGLESLKLIYILQLVNFLQYFSTNLEKLENINFYIFKRNSNKIKLQKSNVHQMKGNFMKILAYFTQKLWKMDDKGSRGSNMRLIFYAPPFSNLKPYFKRTSMSLSIIAISKLWFLKHICINFRLKIGKG